MAIVNTTDRTDHHGGAILFVGIGSGDVSGHRLDESAFLGEDLVFRDEESWEAFWQVHKPYAPAPVVDFRREMVLASFMGVQGSRCNGSAITITGVERSGEALAVQVEETRGQSGCQRRSNPYHLVRCQRVDGPVDFLHEPPRPERSYRSLDHGSWTGYRAGDMSFQGEDLVIEDPMTFQAFWSRHEANRDPAPRPRPAIDFDRSVVVALLLGPQATDCGPRIVAGRAAEETDRLQIVALEDRLPGTCAGPSSPYHIIEVERKDRPVAIERQPFLGGP
jgi:hypothetical protein